MKLFRLLLLALAAPAAALSAKVFTLANDCVRATWNWDGQRLTPISVFSTTDSNAFPLSDELFMLQFADRRALPASGFTPAEAPREEPLAAQPDAARFSERLPGTQLVLRLTNADRTLAVVWRAELRAGSRYLRTRIEVTNLGARPQDLSSLELLDLPAVDAKTSGDFPGSPVVAGSVFLGVEHPLARNRVEGGRILGDLPRAQPLEPGETVRCSAVIGFTAPGQLRRDFLAYLERERARPYRPFLHYNTWYSLGSPHFYTEAGVVRMINAFGHELVEKRGVQLDAFVLDDGWDDPRTLWDFNAGFPDGLKSAQAAAARYHARLGLWLSPWGGYGDAKDQRLSYGREQGFEIRDGSFALAGPNYYRRFSARCAGVIRDYGVNYFKFDGIGGARTGVLDPAAAGDFEAMLRLDAELRKLEPAVYLNQTTGTWPSPWWLFYVDSIWRGGSDHNFAGVGTPRQQWMTYRDGQTYRNVVSRAPLYPLNSLMLHGIIYAAKARGLNTDPGHDFTAEVRSFFGSGTQLQELYISPGLLSAQDWDDLAAAANRSRANAATLADTHWIGGDPDKLAVYGWAAWSPAKGILTLRNPSDQPATITLDAARIFELPAGAPTTYALVSPYADQTCEVKTLRAGQPATFRLKPFEVLVLEARPEK